MKTWVRKSHRSSARSTADTPPITVTADPTQEQLTVALRQLLLGLGPVCSLLGLTHLGTLLGLLAAIAGPVVTIGTIIVGQFHARDTVAKQVVLANASPAQVTIK